MGIKINPDAIKKLEQDLAKRFASGVKVPLGGTEAEAIRSVNDQLRKLGAVPNEAAVRKLVREKRNRAD